ncbi:haloacid dehalogenase type II [Telmatospirillum sp. J64-1]|uniref:haloacid dehalogenase type II n=1 Tax=Telmatospirillum sp. J64-1 TaxID=2502183 RepID=UPI00115F1077|nr:haloacid dehalogenase type II [Telmatospirillum sp. J64-1]
MTFAKPEDIRAVLFDAYGTLFDLGAMIDVCRNGAGDKAPALLDLWRRKQLEYSWLRSLMGRFQDFWHVTGEALDYALETHGLKNPAFRASLMQLWLRPKAYDDAAGCLQRITASGRKTAILSNGSKTMLTAGVKSADLYDLLDVRLSVDNLGIYKPHPSVYEMAANALDLPPKQIAMVSANGWDVAGAAFFGFHAIWVNRQGIQPERLPAGPDHVVSGLTDIPPLLGL